jgi:F0F1-type ATP synthase gamma subunit
VEQLLPCRPKNASREDRCIWDYIYEPDAQTVIDELLVRYVERWCTRPWRKTWRPSNRRAWWP